MVGGSRRQATSSPKTARQPRISTPEEQTSTSAHAKDEPKNSDQQTPTSVYAKDEPKNSEAQCRSLEETYYVVGPDEVLVDGKVCKKQTTPEAHISPLEKQMPTSVYAKDEPKNIETQCRSLAETYYLVGPDEVFVDGKVCKKETVPLGATHAMLMPKPFAGKK